MKSSCLYLDFIVVTLGILLILNVLHYLNPVMKLPFIVIFAGFLAGRYVKLWSTKKAPKIVEALNVFTTE